MKPNFLLLLLLLLGSLLCFTLPTLCQLQIRQQFTSSFTTAATTETLIPIQATLSTCSSTAATTGVPSAPHTTISAIPALAPSATAVPTRSRGQLKKLILDALKKVPDTEQFALLVKSQPELFELLDPESDYIILAPNNAAAKRADASGLEESSSYDPKVALSFVERGVADPPLMAGPRTLKTALKDSAYVNLGPGEPVRVVLGKNLSIASGMGTSITFGEQGYPFGAGTIYVGEDFLTPPGDFLSTLLRTNGAKFLKSFLPHPELSNISSVERVTIFALTDAAIADAADSISMVAALGRHIIWNFAGYLPDLVPGKVYESASGRKLGITIQGGDYFVNDAKIVNTNVIMKNGVVHYVEKVGFPLFAPVSSLGEERLDE